METCKITMDVTSIAGLNQAMNALEVIITDLIIVLKSAEMELG